MTRSAYCLTASLLLAMTLTGCQRAKQPVPVANKVGTTETAEQDRKQREAERMQQCQRELDAMRNMDPERYQKFKREFDALMSGAAQYAGVRPKVNTDTQETVDALYRYRTSRICADISATMMTGLADRGERTQ
ncbi:Uncharacterised protein [Serratia entomophila]|uniref:hypothetical protein n=1 Tax=Serratia entomophila TaxID=42906 RepID=UPI002179125D|nr:hypothetical protein [Serratia entomophila]CAI1009368.1 Uncharacterised protein [Serratia entomophila]CAI1136343.1 Uncharacterised protein [Serratia entomophila]CAI2148437.1 Uncharacterised protein [Serratia entomophila]